MTDAATPAGATPVFALPPVPLTDNFLLQLAADDQVERLWMPTGRPAAVTTRAGIHEGTILTFWIERPEDYTLLEYRTGEAGLRWYCSERTTKDEDLGSILAEHLAGEAWTPLAAVHAEHVASDSETEESDDAEDDRESPVATTRGSGTEASGGEGSARSSGPGERSDEDLLERAMDAANGETFRQLWRGSTTGYPSQSEADMALCCLLAFWTGGDRQRMDRLFRESGLMREKWEEVHYADRRTYGEVTIERALEVTDERYDPSTIGDFRDEAGGSEAANSMATEGSIESGGNAESEGNRGRPRAYLLERNRLLRRRVKEQAARLEALEAALERQANEQSAGSAPKDSSVGGDPEEAMSIRRWVREWLAGDPSKE